MRHRCTALVWTWVFFAAAVATIWLVAPSGTGVATALDVGDVVYVSVDGTCAGHKPCYTSVRGAVASAPWQSTVRVATGTYTEPDTASLGYLVWIAKSLRFEGGWNPAFAARDPAAYPTVLDAQGQGRVVRVYNPAQVINVVIEGFTIQGGNATGLGIECGRSADGCGGGIVGGSASLLIAGNVITGNVATDASSGDYGLGGGVYLTGYSGLVTATLRANIIQNNAACQVAHLDYESNGGGVYVDRFNGVVFVDNQVTGNRAAKGGGVYVSETDGASFSGNVIAGNGALWAGGLYFWISNASTFVGNTIADNAAVGLVLDVSEQVHFEGNTLQGNGDGGAILPGPVTAIGNVLSGNGVNQVGDYAALSVGAPALIEGNVVSGNSQKGIHVDSWEGASVVIRNNTIIDNLSTGLYIEGTGTVQDNVIARNTSPAYAGGVEIWYGSGSVVEGNTFDGNQSATHGGGVYFQGGLNHLVRDNVFTGNSAPLGGGLCFNRCPGSTVTDNVFTDNEAANGGAVAASQTSFAAFEHNSIRGNRAELGGGVYLHDSARLSANDISDNQATDGGGVWTYDRTYLDGNSITGNVATGLGGGLYQQRGTSGVRHNHFSGNQAMAGGAVYVDPIFASSTGIFEGNTVLDNVAGGDGGGFFLSYRGTVTMTNNLLAGNSAAAHGDQLYIYAGYWPSLVASLRHNTFAHHALGDEAVFVGDYTRLSMVNTLLVSHTVGIVEGGVDAGVQADYTFFAFNASNYQGAVTGTHVLTGTSNITSSHEVTGDPAFADPVHRDYRLTAASDAIDAGIDAGVDTDIDGGHRPNGAGYDIGADEWWLRLLLPAVARQYLP